MSSRKKRLKFSWSDFGSMYNKNSQNMENKPNINGRIQNMLSKLLIKKSKKLYFFSNFHRQFPHCILSQSSFKVANSTIPKSHKSLYAPIGSTSTLASDISMLYHFQMARWFVTMLTVISVIFDSFFRQKLTFAVSSSFRSVSWIDQRCGNQNGCQKKDVTDAHFRKPKNLNSTLRCSFLYLINLPLQYLTGNETDDAWNMITYEVWQIKNTGNTTTIHFH